MPLPVEDSPVPDDVPGGNPEWNAVVIAPQDDPAAGSGFEVGIAGKQIRSCVRKRGRFRCGTGCDEFQKIHLEVDMTSRLPRVKFI